MRLIDTHAHLDQIDDLPRELRKSQEIGVEAIIAVSGEIRGGKKTLQIAKKHRGFVYPALGLHPWELGKMDLDAEKALGFIEKNLDTCKAIGEIGLDYSYEYVKKEPERKISQQEVFIFLLTLAREHDLPCCIHSRGAYRGTYELALKHGPNRAVFHWYDGPVKLARKIVENGFYLSCTPAVEYSSGVRNAMTVAPLDQLLLETDAPVHSRRLNRDLMPRDVSLSCQFLAELKGVDAETLGEITSKNAIEFFGLK